MVPSDLKTPKHGISSSIAQLKRKRAQKEIPTETAPKGNQISTNSARLSLVSGSCAGILSTTLMYPMDVLRTKMQTGSGNAGPLRVLKETIRHGGGVKALYTGVTLPLAAQSVYKATVFSVNTVTQNKLLEYRTWIQEKQGINDGTQLTAQDLTMGDRFWCGFVGGAVNAAAFVTPVEFVRNQLIASKLSEGSKIRKKMYANSWDVIRHTTTTKGAASLWRGASWSVGRDAIGCGFFFYTMAATQTYFTKENEKPSLSVTIASGGFAGLSFWVSALPLDTVKTWVQSSDVQAKPISAASIIQNIYLEDGAHGVLRRLFRGWQMAYSRGVPSAAITITSYTVLYQQLESTGIAAQS